MAGLMAATSIQASYAQGGGAGAGAGAEPAAQGVPAVQAVQEQALGARTLIPQRATIAPLSATRKPDTANDWRGTARRTRRS